MQNKYTVRVARDETRSMSRWERMKYRGTAKWVVLFVVAVLAGGATYLVFLEPGTPVPAGVESAVTVRADNESPHLIVQQQDGKIEIISATEDDWHAAPKSAKVFTGDRIRVGKSGFVTLRSPDGSTIRLPKESEVIVNDISRTSSKLLSLRLLLVRGVAWAEIESHDDETIDFALTGDNTLSQTNRATLSLDLHKNLLSVIEGKVDVNVFESGSDADSIIHAADTDRYEVEEGESLRTRGSREVYKTPSYIQRSEWFQWNEKLDTKN